MKKILFILCLAVLFSSCEENRTPKFIDIKKVSLTAFPTLTPWGSSWDTDGTEPDISFFMSNSLGAVGGGSTKTNVSSINPPSWSFEKTMNPPDTYKIVFYEEDPGTASNTMISFYFNYKTGDDYPNPIRCSANGYTVELQVEYKF